MTTARVEGVWEGSGKPAAAPAAQTLPAAVVIRLSLLPHREAEERQCDFHCAEPNVLSAQPPHNPDPLPNNAKAALLLR